MQDSNKFMHDFQNELQKMRSIAKLLLDGGDLLSSEREELVTAGEKTLQQIGQHWIRLAQENRG